MSETGNSVDFEDPSTWPSDLNELERLADASAGPETGADAEGPAAAPETGPEEAAPRAPETPEWVVLADGTHAEPYQTLLDERARAAQYLAEAKRLQAELEEARAAAGQPAGEPAQATQQPDAAAEYQALKERYEAIKDEDPELGEAYRGTLLALDGQRALAAQVQEMHGAFASQRHAEQQARAAEIQAAVAGNPQLSGLMADPAWSARLIATEQALAADPGSRYSQAQDWGARFAAVVEAAGAIYGEPPVPAAAKGPRGAAKPVSPLAPPPSLSALAGGTHEADIGQDPVAALERMAPQQMIDWLGKMQEQGRLADMINQVS